MQLAANVLVAQRFRLNRQLGRGGMGAVWHASDLRLDKACAVKFIEGEFAQMPEAQSRFQREAKAAAALNSPHVVTIYDHGVWEGTPYIAMELLEGEDLGKRLSRVGRLSPRDAIEIMTQVQRALAKAHAAGIVHRDLKPDNIYLVPDEERELAKVLDFGIAKSANQALEGSSTKTGAMLGTPYYMSPEQAQGIKAVDHRSDLWSLGVIVFQMLTGKLPFESEALGDLLVKIIVTPPPMPSHFVQDLPPSFDEWWRKASQRDPAMRFQSAKELVDELKVALGSTSPHGTTDPMGRPSFVQGQGPGGTVALSQSGGGYGQQPGAFHQSGAGYAQQQPPAYSQSGAGYGQQPQQPGAYSQSGAGYGQTPQPGMQASTGAPVAGTFSGQQVTPQPPKSRTGVLVGVGVGVVAVVGIVGVVVAMKSGGGGPAAAAGGAASAVTSATVAAVLPTASAPVATVQPTAEPSAVVATSDSAIPAASSGTTAKVVHGGGGGGGSHPSTTVAGAKTGAAATTPPAGPKKQDLGF
jgi:serine/threonine-protein kinase